MKVILNTDHDTLGRKGDVVEVKRGYARNFLFPRNLALPATTGALRQAEQMKRSREERDRQERAAAEELAARIAASPIRIVARAGEDGQLFGSITTSDIAERLAAQLEVEIDRRKVSLTDPIRSLGVHPFEVQLHPEVLATGSIEAVAEG